MSSEYADSVADIVKELADDKDEMISEIANLCETIANSAYDQGEQNAEEKRDNQLQDDLCLATNEWSEIVASFIRCDMPDVRSRLMDMGQLLGRDVWIPSR